MLRVKIVIKVDWLFVWVVLMSDHGSSMVDNFAVNYCRVPWMAAIPDWMYVVSLFIGIRMIHLSNFLVLIIRRDTEAYVVGVMISSLHFVRSGFLIEVTNQRVALYNNWGIAMLELVEVFNG